MEILQTAAELQAAQDLFKKAFEALPNQLLHTSIGYQGGNYEADVIWVPSLDIWGFFGLPPNEKPPRNRFWNPFGLGKPRSQVSIVCEINPPRTGANAATGGVFLRGSQGEIIVVHRGRFTVTRGMPTSYFLSSFRGERVGPPNGHKKPILAKVADLQPPRFGQDLANFIREVRRIKDLRRNEH